MPEAARMFLCARCRAQVFVCRRCDRGQRYCAGACAGTARRQAQRAAAQRYQRSEAGRIAHAERSRRYRARRSRVTHQGSIGPPAAALLALKAAAASSLLARRDGADLRCSFCGAACAQGVRQGFLRRPARALRCDEAMRLLAAWPGRHR